MAFRKERRQERWNTFCCLRVKNQPTDREEVNYTSTPRMDPGSNSKRQKWVRLRSSEHYYQWMFKLKSEESAQRSCESADRRSSDLRQTNWDRGWGRNLTMKKIRNRQSWRKQSHKEHEGRECARSHSRAGRGYTIVSLDPSISIPSFQIHGL